jgi:C-terminal processing protease CtpA/Prc
VNGYNADLKITTESHFMEKDSSVAIVEIRSLTKEISDLLQSFQKIDSYKSKTLILDLRDNGGGTIKIEIVGYTRI